MTRYADVRRAVAVLNLRDAGLMEQMELGLV
jgi:hypothetical protein